MPSRRVAIALGSNVGDRRSSILSAADRLASVVSSLTLSDIVETQPEGIAADSDQPDYLNAVVVGETTLEARDLLEALLRIEIEHGRERPYVGAPRTLDLDLVLLGEEILDEPGLQVPHPRFRDRFFVLGPMAEVAPDFLDPVTGKSVTELLRQLLRDENR